MEKLWNQLVAELRKYVADNGFSEVILGLSGGVDSAMVAVLAAEALGGEKVHSIMMKTQYTSELSLEIARKIAKLNGLQYQEIDIQPIVDEQQKFLTQIWGGSPKNIVLENLQARERGKILMAFSNQYGYLVLACGNKSETAMGYCTLYGDTCGGLAPIGDVYKSTIFELAKWRNLKNEVFPKEVISRPPSAELSLNQKDEDSLPPYAVLDKILEAYIDDGLTVEEVVSLGFKRELVQKIVGQYHKMVYKRKQMAENIRIVAILSN